MSIQSTYKPPKYYVSAIYFAHMVPVDVSTKALLPDSAMSFHAPIWQAASSQMRTSNASVACMQYTLASIALKVARDTSQTGCCYMASWRNRKGVESDLGRSLPLEGPDSSLGGGVLLASLDPPRAMGASVPSSHCLGLTRRPLLLVSPVVKPAGTASSSSALRFRCMLTEYPTPAQHGDHMDVQAFPSGPNWWCFY